MSEPTARCSACQQEIAPARDIEAILAHDCPEHSAWSRGYRSGYRAALAQVEDDGLWQDRAESAQDRVDALAELVDSLLDTAETRWKRAEALRAILQDLIAELRDEHGKRPHPLVGGSDMCQSCGVTFTVNGYCPTWHITDRAEARLREAGGDE